MDNETITKVEQTLPDVTFLADECGDTLWDVVLQQAEIWPYGIKPVTTVAQ
jgi:hypothetical protein